MSIFRFARLAPLIVASGVAVLLASCGEEQKAAAPPPPVVTVAHPTRRTVIDMDEYVGRFVAVNSVEIRARVSGYLDQVHFTDGQTVKQGDLLFSIDKRPFQTSLDQARANLAQARANLAFADSDLARGAQLVRDKTITEQTFDQRTQAKRVAEASVQAQGAAAGAHRRPARPARQPGARRPRRNDHLARHHRVDRSDALRVHLR